MLAHRDRQEWAEPVVHASDQWVGTERGSLPGPILKVPLITQVLNDLIGVERELNERPVGPGISEDVIKGVGDLFGSRSRRGVSVTNGAGTEREVPGICGELANKLEGPQTLGTAIVIEHRAVHGTTQCAYRASCPSRRGRGPGCAKRPSLPSAFAN